MKIELLIDSNKFWTRLHADLLSSQYRVYIQTLSFEGDRVGQALSNVLLELTSIDVKVLIDSFAKWVINDKWVYSPLNLLDGALHHEFRSTIRMIDNLQRNGIEVKFVNPAGFLFVKSSARNHKKLVLVDDHIAYLGGMNFSEHNFSWHDLMLRIEDCDVNKLLALDFLSTWEGKVESRAGHFSGIEIYTLDGYSNHVTFNRIRTLIEQTKEKVFVESPYLSFPFCESLRKAQKEGATVTVVSPQENN